VGGLEKIFSQEFSIMGDFTTKSLLIVYILGSLCYNIFIRLNNLTTTKGDTR